MATSKKKKVATRKVKIGGARKAGKTTSLKQEVEAYHQKILKNGGKLTHYYCHHHQGLVATVQPSKDQVTDKGYWDSATTCIECGGMNFVVVYPNGRTKSKAMPIGRSGKNVELTAAQAGKIYTHNPGHKHSSS